MRIRVKEIRKAQKRRQERYKAAHKQTSTPAGASSGRGVRGGSGAPRATGDGRSSGRR